MTAQERLTAIKARCGRAMGAHDTIPRQLAQVALRLDDVPALIELAEALLAGGDTSKAIARFTGEDKHPHRFFVDAV